MALQQPYAEKVDVYSFAIVVWQMATNKVPFKDFNKALFMTEVVGKGERPKLSKRLPQELNSLLLSCWHSNWRCRPSFATIVKRLDGLMLQYGGFVGGGISLKPSSIRLFSPVFGENDQARRYGAHSSSPALPPTDSSSNSSKSSSSSSRSGSSVGSSSGICVNHMGRPLKKSFSGKLAKMFSSAFLGGGASSSSSSSSSSRILRCLLVDGLAPARKVTR